MLREIYTTLIQRFIIRLHESGAELLWRTCAKSCKMTLAAVGVIAVHKIAHEIGVT